MAAKNSTQARVDLVGTAHHEAAHAVMYDRLGLVCVSATIALDEASGEEGHTRHGGDNSPDESELLSLRCPKCLHYDARACDELKDTAEDAYWLRHAIASYAGAESARRRGVVDWKAGAGGDYDMATEAVNNITDDATSIDLLFKLAKRRCEILVDHYWPEIELVAAALLGKSTLTGEEVHEIVVASALKRRAPRLGW